jgi:GAF domain-containing protein
MVSRGDHAGLIAFNAVCGHVHETVEVALLDLDGVIVHTNAAWDDFCLQNDGTLASVGVGVSYLQTCDGSGDDPAAVAVGDAIRMALRGDLPAPLSILVPCDAPEEPRVFNTLISSRFDDVGARIGATVTLSRATADEPTVNDHHLASATPPRRTGTPDPLTALLRVSEIVPAELSHGDTLRRLVESARELLGVSYVAIGVSGREGLLEECACAGIDAQTEKRLGSGPAILEWLSELPNSLQRDVALRGRQLVSLYVAENEAARFTPHVERLAAGFADAAGTAIDNARLYQLARQNHRWAEAAAELTQELGSRSSTTPVDIVLGHAVSAADADLAAVLVPEDDLSIRLISIVGSRDGLQSGMLFPAADVMLSGKPLLLDRPTARVHEVSDRPMGPIAVVPLTAGRTVLGALVVSRLIDRTPFATPDVVALSRFASYAGIALELDRAQTDREQLQLHDDRARIAAELHDQVVRQLFAVGMGLEGIIEAIDDAELRARVGGYVTALDDSIRGIRETIYRIDEV